MTSTPLAADQRPWWRVCARAVWRALPVIVGVTIVTTLLQHYHLLDPLESAALDANIAWTRVTDTSTIIVTINDDDYQNMFRGQSPLDPAKLEPLIKRILDFKPAVLGVDIVTAEPGDQTLDDHLGNDSSRVVWVRDAVPIADANEKPDAKPEPKWRLDRVLGADPPPGDAKTGLSLFPRDADGFVRRYYRVLSLTVPTKDDPQKKDDPPKYVRIVEPSFAWAILTRFCKIQGTQQPQCARILRLAEERTAEPLWFNFAGDRYTFRKIPAGALAAMAAGDDPPIAFKDKIVLFGGTFGAARDTYPTLLGELSGVELAAFAVESELKGGGIKPSNERLMLAMDIVAGIVLVCLCCFWPPDSLLNVALIAAGMIILALAVSFAAFHAFSYWGSFIPIGVSVLLHQFYERMAVARHTRHELERYRQRYGPL